MAFEYVSIGRFLTLLDALDISILRELTQARMVLPARLGTSPSFREMAKKLNLPHATLRYRIRRMYSSGVIIGSSVFPNPNLLGLKTGACTMDISPLLRKEDVVKRLELVDDVFFIHDFLGSLVWVIFNYESEESRRKKLDVMQEITGAEGIYSQIPFPPCSVELSRAEAEFLLYLTSRGLSTYARLARELGVSVRTIKRRLSKLVNGNSLVSLPRVNYGALKNCAPADLLILFRDQDAAKDSERRVLPLVQDHVILAALWDVVGMCSLILPNVPVITELVGKIRQVDGVAAARIEIVKQHIDLTRNFTEYVQKWMRGKGFLKTAEQIQALATRRQ